jgi:hypothetical protein
LDAVIQKALAKEPDERFQTASALSEAFQAALERPTARSLERATPVVVPLAEMKEGEDADSVSAAPGREHTTPVGASGGDWSPPVGFFPLPAEAAGGAPARVTRRNNKMVSRATGDPLGEQPTIPAAEAMGLGQRAGWYPQQERAARYRRNLLGMVALLAFLLLGGALVILGNDLIHQIGDNVPANTPVIQHTAGPQGTSTAASTQSPRSRPTNTPDPTSSVSPSPTNSPTPTNTPQSTPTNTPVPTNTPPAPTPTGG